MSGRFFYSGTIPLFEGAAQPLSTLTFSLTGTGTAQDTFTSAGLTAANANPVVSDANGYFGEIFLKRERYRVIWKNAAGTTLKTFDPVDKGLIFTRGAGLPSDPHPGQRHANTSDSKTYEYKLASASWLDLGTSDTVGNTASVTEQLTGTSASVYATPDSVAGLWQRGADIASAATISLPAAGGGVYNITGTTGISAIGSAQGGRCIKVRFAGALILTHNAVSLILPGAANITTVSGDTAEFINEAAADASGSNWRCFRYTRASGSPLNITDQAAAQADQETPVSSALFVTPLRQHFHQSAAKFWGYATVSGGVPTAGGDASYNVTSFGDTGTGRTTVTIATDFSSAAWCCLTGNEENAIGSATVSMIDQGTVAAGTVVVQSMNTGASALASFQDPDSYHVVGFGDQA